jgi:hypothetical protein
VEIITVSDIIMMVTTIKIIITTNLIEIAEILTMLFPGCTLTLTEASKVS